MLFVTLHWRPKFWQKGCVYLAPWPAAARRENTQPFWQSQFHWRPILITTSIGQMSNSFAKKLREYHGQDLKLPWRHWAIASFNLGASEEKRKVQMHRNMTCSLPRRKKESHLALKEAAIWLLQRMHAIRHVGTLAENSDNNVRRANPKNLRPRSRHFHPGRP